MEDDGFVLVSKDFVAEDDDAVSVSSSRSSLFMVEDPSADEVMLHGEKEEETPPVVKSTVLPLDKAIDMTGEAIEEDENLSDETQQAEQVEAVPKEQPKFVCSSCSSDVAVQADVIWEGYMGANKAAYLFQNVLNLEPAAEPRKQQLSTGLFLLQDMRCKSCSTSLGWSYLKAWNQDQKYKEGTTIIQQSLLDLVGESSNDEEVLCL